MKRIIVDYKKLPKEIMMLLVEKYPDGYSYKDVIRFKNARNEMVEALEVRTSDTIYLVKVSTQLATKMENFDEDDDFSSDDDLDTDISINEEGKKVSVSKKKNFIVEEELEEEEEDDDPYKEKDEEVDDDDDDDFDEEEESDFDDDDDDFDEEEISPKGKK